MASERSSRFHTTQWSLIAALPGSSDSADGREQEALEHLCEAYWRPLYAFARYSGHSAEDARDLTQGFLANMIESRGLGGADPDRGRFRSYLLGAMKHFIANAHQQARAKKRGGEHRFVQADLSEMESQLMAQGGIEAHSDPDRAFDRSWAQETTNAALEELEAEWSARGKLDQFEALRPSLTGEISDRPGTAERLGMAENALSVAVHRLRRRYASLVRDAVARTVTEEADVEAELRYLVSVLREK